MALLPDRGRMLFTEQNVDVTAALEPEAAYDLTLFPELGRSDRGVLEVKVIMNFIFEDGVSSSGSALEWKALEQARFMAGVKIALLDKWSEKHRITTASRVPMIKDIGVVFDVDVRTGVSVFEHSHWNLTVTKADPADASPVSSVTCGGGGLITNGEVTLDSKDLDWKRWGHQRQRGIVHEFGHMLGYRDEYVDDNGNPEDNSHWLWDLNSVMNSGEEVRARHYVLFTEWLNTQFKFHARLASRDITWRVAGRYDTINADI